ncbi:MAG TPA: mechanosensitive ion channel domain-containing protein, partial [Stellaceae bacterium]|nr:mechanosensitive ion channel domain-containing protein [Stellaceae bacterium]
MLAKRGHETGWDRPPATGWRLALALLLSMLCAVAQAAQPNPAASAPVSEADLERLVGTLQDPAARARLVAELRALIQAQRAAPTPSVPAAPAAPAKTAAKPTPQTAAIVLFGRLSKQVDAATGEILAGAAVVVDAPRLVGWLERQVANPTARNRWITAGYAVALVFGLALLVEWALRLLLARVTPRFPVRRSDSRPVRALFALIGFIIDALPILVFAGTAYAAIEMGPASFAPTRLMLSVLVSATVEARLFLCIARALLLPADAGAVFVPIGAETRNYLYIWFKRFVFVAAYGYAIPEAAWWLGIPGPIYALMLNLTGLVLALLAIVFALQNRVAIGRWIAGDPPSATGWGRIRRTFGEIWALLAVVYIVGIYLIYALRIEGGFGYVLRATVLSLVVIVAARLAVRAAHRLSRRGFALSPELKAQFPTLEHRANRYLPILTMLVAAAVYLVAALTVLQAWNVAAFAWFDSALGRRLIGRLAAIGLMVAIALALWEIVDAAIERHLNGVGHEGAPHRARMRSLLPLLRTAALSVIVVLTGLIVLSHLGIDIAPLLAGAGVIGVAIGFGSQALVKDIITGLFILVENQFAVGDIVDVGKDHAGVVEAITIRTVRLRDQAGTVHTVPFSEVTSVKNLSRDYAHVVARITISYREDIDRVVAILREVTDELMTDDKLRPLILDPFDYQGVDALDEFWVVLLLRIRTLPLQQFVVGRAFNRLVKIAFDKHGIAGRDPNPVAIADPA